MTSYGEMLRDPRWQRKRLEIMERDKFTCRECQSTTRTLNVHHINYVSGRAPWDYPDTNFRTLCDVCHEQLETDIRAVRSFAAYLSADDRNTLIGFARGLVFLKWARRGILSADDAFPVENRPLAIGLEAALASSLLKIDGSVVLARAIGGSLPAPTISELAGIYTGPAKSPAKSREVS
jgi:hypothetical protein